jgi:CHAD domain-containing protein
MNRRQKKNGFYLQPAEKIEDEIARALCEQLQGAAQVLASTRNADEAIHDARRGLKKARALLKLGRRSALGPHYEDESIRLRDLGRTLSGVRDAMALVEAAGRIAEEERSKEVKAAARGAKRLLLRKKDAITADFLKSGEKDRVTEALKKAVGDSDGWPVEQIDFSAIRKGVKRTVKQGRQARKRASSDPRPENFHEWRKLAKDFRYQLRFLRKLSPDGFKKNAGKAKELEQKLGEDHNLAVLREAVKDLSLQESDVAALTIAIEKRQAKLRTEALRIGESLYKDGPKLWARHLTQYWAKQK